MHIQYTSDLHLELYSELPAFEDLLKPSAPYLVLAGDIGHPEQLKPLFAWISDKWEHVFYVAGNHEYYGAKYDDRLEELKACCHPYPNIHFLHSDSPSFYLAEENVVFIGCTLWTEVSKSGDWRSVNDYRAIRFNISPFTMLNALHDAEQRILNSEITNWSLVSPSIKICVITHHIPSFRLIHPRFAMSTINECFASHSDHLMRPPVCVWIYGHTHCCNRTLLKNVMCVCNAKGYIDELVPGWQVDACVEISEHTSAVQDETYAKEEEIEFQ